MNMKTAFTKAFIGQYSLHTGLSLLIGTALSVSALTLAPAQAAANQPPLIITNAPLPPELRSQIYSKPRVAPQTYPHQITGSGYFGEAVDTAVGRKVDSLRQELAGLQHNIAQLSGHLAHLESDGQRIAADYYASIATISTQLQSGTTPSNPRLIQRLTTARESLEKLSHNVSLLNDLALKISQAASLSSFLLDSARSTYSLTGAVEEDHVRLAQLEDAVNSTVVVIDRLLNNVNDDITRTSAYLTTERDNLRVMALAINTGDMFGKSLGSRPFSGVQQASFTPVPVSRYAAPGQMLTPEVPPLDSAYPQPSLTPEIPAPRAPLADRPAGPRPLVKIRFDRADVAFQQPVYMAVNEALARYPNARFELIAVHPGVGNPAEIAIESTRSRRNAERVLRSLTEMGLSLDRVDLSYTPSPEATTNEVHLYVR